MAGEGADEGPGLALGPQRGVDLPQRALGRAVRAGPHHAGREPGGRPERGVLVRPGTGLGDEDDVDVADVVELAPAALAHADHREAAQVGLVTELGTRDRQARLQRRRGEVGQLGGDVVHVEHVGEVASREVQQCLPVRRRAARPSRPARSRVATRRPGRRRRRAAGSAAAPPRSGGARRRARRGPASDPGGGPDGRRAPSSRRARRAAGRARRRRRPAPRGCRRSPGAGAAR